MSLGVPFIIAIFAGVLGTDLRDSEYFSENLLVLFFVTVFVSYFLGATWRTFWASIEIKCPRCNSLLFCRECNFHVTEINDYEYQENKEDSDT